MNNVKIRFFSMILLLLCSNIIFSQVQSIDSLNIKIYQGGTGTDSIVTRNQSNGRLRVRSLASVFADIKVSNGLVKQLDTIQLGGILTKATTITTNATNTLAIAGLQSGAATDSILVVNPSTGLISRVAPSKITSNIYTANGDVAPTTATSRAVNFTKGGSLNIDSNTLFIDATKNSVGIGTSSPTNSLEINPASGVINTGLKLPRGAKINQVLTSDSAGNAIWKDNATLVFEGVWNSGQIGKIVSNSSTSLTPSGLSIILPPGKYYITAQVGYDVNGGIDFHPYIDISQNSGGSSSTLTKFVGNSYSPNPKTHVKIYSVIYDLTSATSISTLYVNTYHSNTANTVKIGGYADQFYLHAIKM